MRIQLNTNSEDSTTNIRNLKVCTRLNRLTLNCSTNRRFLLDYIHLTKPRNDLEKAPPASRTWKFVAPTNPSRPVPLGTIPPPLPEPLKQLEFVQTSTLTCAGYELFCTRAESVEYRGGGWWERGEGGRGFITDKQQPTRAHIHENTQGQRQTKTSIQMQTQTHTQTQKQKPTHTHTHIRTKTQS